MCQEGHVTCYESHMMCKEGHVMCYESCDVSGGSCDVCMLDRSLPGVGGSVQAGLQHDAGAETAHYTARGGPAQCQRRVINVPW